MNADTAAGKTEEPKKLASGMVVVFVNPLHPQWCVGLVLSVWKKAFKGNKGEVHQSQLTHVPVDLRLLHSFRVTKLDRTAAGQFHCTGRAETFLCKADCLALTMQAVRERSAPSAFVCSLGPSDAAVCNDALEKLDLPQVAAVADTAGQKLLSAAANKWKAKDAKMAKELVDTKDAKDAKPKKQLTVVEEMHRLLRLDMRLT